MRRYLNDDCLMPARQPSCVTHRWSLPIPASSLGPKDSYQPAFLDECSALVQAAGDQGYGIPSPSSSSSFGSLPSSPSDMAGMSPNYISPGGGSHIPDFCEEPLRTSPERLSGRPNSFYWQEMATTCKELLLSCRQAKHADMDGEELKKVQEHIRKMSSLCKAINDTLAQKKKRRSKWTTYHYYSPNRSMSYQNDKPDEQHVGHGSDRRVCFQCNTSRSPEWRSGPLGSKTLCNACGIRYSKAIRQQRQGNPLSIKNLLN